MPRRQFAGAGGAPLGALHVLSFAGLCAPGRGDGGLGTSKHRRMRGP